MFLMLSQCEGLPASGALPLTIVLRRDVVGLINRPEPPGPGDMRSP